MQNILITGANRGLGLELTRQYLHDDAGHIFATCRNPDRADELQALAAASAERIRVLPLDVNDETSIVAARASVAAVVDGLDLLINNAGIFPKGDHQSRELGDLSASDVSDVVVTNSVGPLMVTQAFRRLLQNGERPRVVMISSGMGSVTRAAGGSFAYRMSKAAMNMAARVLALDNAMQGIITITTHPGWVQTDMGGPSAEITPAQSASGLRSLIGQLSQADNGKFFLYDGSELEW
jgi:NAD(P)-dependent dehydrogenase (short-subunit alcohol dehydrogenase family)